MTENGPGTNLGNKTDLLSLENLTTKKHRKKMPKKEPRTYTRRKMINGHPYWYEITVYYDEDGKRRQRSRYLGKRKPRENRK